MLDLEGEEIAQLYGCECDLDFRCNVPQCEMETDFVARSYAWMRSASPGWFRNYAKGELP